MIFKISTVIGAIAILAIASTDDCEFATPDRKLVINFVSDTELEYKEDGLRVLCLYTKKEARLRAVCERLGSKQVIYLDQKDDTLKHEDGRVLTCTSGSGQAMNILAQAQIGRNGPLANALASYKWDMGKYPDTADGLRSLFRQKEPEDTRYKGPYLEGTFDELRDPWNEPFEYRSPGKMNDGGFDLWSHGPDKKNDDGKEGSDDIKNWNDR